MIVKGDNGICGFCVKLILLAVTTAPCLTGRAQNLYSNAAMLTTVKVEPDSLRSSDASAPMGHAELWLTKEKGGLTDFNGSPDVLTAGANVESLFRLSPHTVVFGAMNYENFTGHDMGGSAFTNLQPSTHSTLGSVGSYTHLPFDLVEWTDYDKQDSIGANTGTKHRDTYRLSGAFGYSVTDGFAIGARLNYTAANYAKYKDLRHKNKLMDMEFSAGVYSPLTRWLGLGASYIYHRNTETVTFSTYGKTDRTYETLIDYGAFMGRVEQFGGTGYTDRSREMPLVSDCNGLGLQALFTMSRHTSFFHEVTLAHRTGYYGRRSPYTITYSEHSSDITKYSCRLTQQSSGATHIIGLDVAVENLQNDANTYRDVQNETGASYYEYYTPVKTANRVWADVSMHYSLELRGKWAAHAQLDYRNREQKAYLYPYYRYQDLSTIAMSASVTRNILLSKGMLSLQLDAAFQQGQSREPEVWSAVSPPTATDTEQPCYDGTFATPSDKQSPPASMDAYLWREYQWWVAPQRTIGGTAKYTFVFPGTNMPTHIRLTVHHRKANHTYNYSQGCDRTTATVAIGCSF